MLKFSEKKQIFFYKHWLKSPKLCTEEPKILWDKTVPAAYAERVGVVYLLENSLTRFYNIFSSVSWSVLQISYLVCSAFSVYIGQ